MKTGVGSKLSHRARSAPSHLAIAIGLVPHKKSHAEGSPCSKKVPKLRASTQHHYDEVWRAYATQTFCSAMSTTKHFRSAQFRVTR